MPNVKTRDGADLSVKNSGSGRPVVLIHGWPPVEYDGEPHGLTVTACDRFGTDLPTFLGR